MPRTRKSTLFKAMKSHTPCADFLTKKYDLKTSAVFGRIWRYAEGKNGVCNAEISTIADSLNLTYKTVLGKIKILCKDGLIIDHSPKLRNRPHTYSIAEKEVWKQFQQFIHKDDGNIMVDAKSIKSISKELF